MENRRADLSTADWRFMLPSLDADRVLLLGVPSAGTIAAFAQSAGWLGVVSSDTRAIRVLRLELRRRGLSTVEVVDDAQKIGAPVDLVASVGKLTRKRIAEIAHVSGRLIAPRGVLFIEAHGHLQARHLRWWTRTALPPDTFNTERFLVLRRNGDIRAVFPARDAVRTSRYLVDNVFYGLSAKGRLLKRAGQLLARTRLLRLAIRGHAFVIQRVPLGEDPTPRQAFVGHAVAGAGGSVCGGHTAMFFRGNYNSNKVAAFSFAPRGRVPALIVKMTRAPAFNYRLETEHNSLTRLHNLGFVPEGSYPAPLFLDHHRGLAILGQQLVEGTPLRESTSGDAGCPLGLAGIEWIIQLGAGSSTSPLEATATRPRMGDLLSAFADRYPVSQNEFTFLEQRCQELDREGAKLPLVFEHGDAGTWNVLARTGSRVVFLDWESSRAEGFPLWDLFYFLRSLGTWAMRSGGTRDKGRAYAAAFLDPGPFSALQASAVRRYCAEAGVGEHAVDPLFYTCWMHRALKEATWTQGPLEDGTYFNLIRLTIRHRKAEGLRWMDA